TPATAPVRSTPAPAQRSPFPCCRPCRESLAPPSRSPSADSRSPDRNAGRHRAATPTCRGGRGHRLQPLRPRRRRRPPRPNWPRRSTWPLLEVGKTVRLRRSGIGKGVLDGGVRVIGLTEVLAECEHER